MVEGRLIARGMRKHAAAAACVAALFAGGPARAVDTPRGFDSSEDELARPLTDMPHVTPLPPSPLDANSAPIASATAPGNPLWGVPLQSLTATRERPLFSSSRRPPMSPAARVPVETPKPVAPVADTGPPLDLLGVVVGGGAAYAVFVNSTTRDIVRLKKGEGDNGWILQSVTNREATLEKDHRTAVVRLPSATQDQK